MYVYISLSLYRDYLSIGIIPILLENPECRPICDRDRENPDFDSCSDIFVKFSEKKTKCRILNSDVPEN